MAVKLSRSGSITLKTKEFLSEAKAKDEDKESRKPIEVVQISLENSLFKVKIISLEGQER